ncbi:hypothetical protein OO012_08755 [Rhodobacteraceae bacterium KMM 6894]|nr:hypothetical protein [Rhodobacteraceae bacterium KMM 6894]
MTGSELYFLAVFDAVVRHGGFAAAQITRAGRSLKVNQLFVE